jgi:hypothetical protein
VKRASRSTTSCRLASEITRDSIQQTSDISYQIVQDSSRSSQEMWSQCTSDLSFGSPNVQLSVSAGAEHKVRVLTEDHRG